MNKKRVDNVLALKPCNNLWGLLMHRKHTCRNKNQVLECLSNAFLHVRILICLDKLVNKLFNQLFFTKPLLHQNRTSNKKKHKKDKEAYTCGSEGLHYNAVINGNELEDKVHHVGIGNVVHKLFHTMWDAVKKRQGFRNFSLHQRTKNFRTTRDNQALVLLGIARVAVEKPEEIRQHIRARKHCVSDLKDL